MELAKRGNSLSIEERLKEQFALRCAEFDISANWITDERLIAAHTEMAGAPSGKALELCCGTGQVGCALKAKGWDALGLDICSSMVEASSRYFPVVQGKAENIPFKSGCLRLVVCRQAFQFLNIRQTLSEIARVLEAQGTFILSLTVPFSEEDRSWLYKVHRIKQPLLNKFYTAQDLAEELKREKFSITETRSLRVRESVTEWMKHAPELSCETRERVIASVEKAPAIYKKLHNAALVSGEVFEDWKWIIFKASFPKT